MPHLYGAQHQRATLTDHDVLSIRAGYSPGNITMRELADKYRTTVANVSGIVLGRTWKHLPVKQWEAREALVELEEGADQ